MLRKRCGWSGRKSIWREEVKNMGSEGRRRRRRGERQQQGREGGNSRRGKERLQVGGNEAARRGLRGSSEVWTDGRRGGALERGHGGKGRCWRDAAIGAGWSSTFYGCTRRRIAGRRQRLSGAAACDQTTACGRFNPRRAERCAGGPLPGISPTVTP